MTFGESIPERRNLTVICREKTLAPNCRAPELARFSSQSGDQELVITYFLSSAAGAGAVRLARVPRGQPGHFDAGDATGDEPAHEAAPVRRIHNCRRCSGCRSGCLPQAEDIRSCQGGIPWSGVSTSKGHAISWRRPCVRE